MLTNLRGVYLREEKFQQGLAVADLLSHLDPGNPVWRRDRGLLYRQLDCPEQAREDLEAYLASAPPSHDTETIRELLKSMAENPRVLH
jgi:regulator of sirC expression with transglutaminase-like and TPR domain